MPVHRPVAKTIVIRSEVRPGDLSAIVAMHGRLYAEEQGFDARFEAYVAGPLAECVSRGAARERIWIAESGGRIAGSVAIVAASDSLALLRWFLVEPASRGRGLGTTLLHQAVEFAREAGYASIDLWTVDALAAAARLYEAAGFRLVEERPGMPWGCEVVEQRYQLGLHGS